MAEKDLFFFENSPSKNQKKKLEKLKAITIEFYKDFFLVQFTKKSYFFFRFQLINKLLEFRQNFKLIDKPVKLRSFPNKTLRKLRNQKCSTVHLWDL